jgi:hypothetical protein
MALIYSINSISISPETTKNKFIESPEDLYDKILTDNRLNE